MKHDYGYFTRTLGYDGDAIDVFIGNNLKSIKLLHSVVAIVRVRLSNPLVQK